MSQTHPMTRLEVVNVETLEVVKTVDMTTQDPLQIQKMSDSLLRHMNTFEFFVRATPTGALSAETVAQFDFHAHLARQAAWSAKTFGPGARTKGLCDHISKELVEIAADPHDLGEWIDIVILGLDGAWRCGGTPEQIIAGLAAKQAKNEGRTWPDWRTADPDKAIEHDRSGEQVAQKAV